MTSFVIVELPNLHNFVEHNISYQPCKFQLSRMSGSNFTEGGGGGKHRQCCTGRKKPSAFRVKWMIPLYWNRIHSEGKYEFKMI